MTAETAQDESNTLANSRTNLTKRRRDRSKASSRRSQRNDQEENMHAKPATPDEDRYLRPERKPKSRFLSILNCCSASEPDNEDPDLPAKRAETRLPPPGRQPPSEKVDVSAAESSTAESKDHQLLNEKTGDSAAHPPHAEEPQEQPNILPIAEGRSDLVGEYATAPRSEPSNKQPANVPSDLSLGKKDGSGDEIEPESTPGQSQDDRDIAITDAPIPSSEEGEEPVPTQDVAPPPPQPPPPDVYLPGPPTATGKQNIWLLPPPLPHLDGRKCLILDLDETLVHSSFKVCIHQPN
jgi:RNA polymerase II subunit A small phosphatase-like protein